MRLIVLLFIIALPLFLLAEDVPLDSLPLAVQETIDSEKGDGVVKSAESFDWGNVVIFKVHSHLPTIYRPFTEPFTEPFTDKFADNSPPMHRRSSCHSCSI